MSEKISLDSSVTPYISYLGEIKILFPTIL